MVQIDPIFPPRPTALVRDMLTPWIHPGDRVIDATAGNGHDTVFLAGCVGKTGQVLAFDVLETALRSAEARLTEAGIAERVRFILGSHATMADHAEAASVAAVMFNLGYLPGDDHALTTEKDGTLRALEVAAGLLKKGGMITVVCYPGHPAGAVEAEAVENWMETRGRDGWWVARYGAVGTRSPAPFLLVCKKG